VWLRFIALSTPVAAALHRQVQERHQPGLLGVRADQALGDIVRVARGVAYPLQFRDLGKRFDQAVEAHAIGRPGIDVLPEQGDLARAGFDQDLRFAQQILERPRNLRAAGIGHDAIRAELVAPFLDRQEGARPRAAARRQRGEFGVRGHVGVGRALAPGNARDHLGQPVIGLRADHEADARRAGHDLLALGLRDAAGDRDHRRRIAAGLYQPDRCPNRPSRPPSRGCGRC
jgi:hypothetical protein